jgi:acyl-CoA thioesterase I
MKPKVHFPSRRARLRLLFALFLLIPPALFADGATRVACVGDSITYGSGLKNRDHDSYPAWLGHWMGTGYDVRNFGHSGATLLKKGDTPYDHQAEYTAAVVFKPDVVVIMLGTNDSKHRGDGSLNSDKAPDNWQYKGDYVSDYEALIGEFRNANPAAKIYVVYPTPCFPGRWGINDDTIHHEVIPLVHQVATDSHATVIDLYDAFAGRKDLFPDTVHPNATGARLMAADIYAVLTGKAAP